MCVVATPFVVRQIQGDRQAIDYRRSPSLHPTRDFPLPSSFLGRFVEGLADRCVGGTVRLVGRLPMPLLAFPRLCRGEARMGKGVSVLTLEEYPAPKETDAVEGGPEVTECETECGSTESPELGRSERTCNSRTA